jgi:hypothetical protein
VSAVEDAVMDQPYKRARTGNAGADEDGVMDEEGRGDTSSLDASSPYGFCCVQLASLYERGNAVRVSRTCRLYGPTLSMKAADVRRIMSRFQDQLDVHLARMKTEGKIHFVGEHIVLGEAPPSTSLEAPAPATPDNAWDRLRDAALAHPLLGRKYRQARAPVVGAKITAVQPQSPASEGQGAQAPPSTSADDGGFDEAQFASLCEEYS